MVQNKKKCYICIDLKTFLLRMSVLKEILIILKADLTRNNSALCLKKVVADIDLDKRIKIKNILSIESIEFS